MSWIVASFSPEQGFGKVRNAETGDELAFQLESWVPCDPATARALQDSDFRRSLLLPIPGEPVDVDPKSRRVMRKNPIDCVLSPMTFREWFAKMSSHIPALASWEPSEWNEWIRHIDDEIDEVVFSPEPAPPESHLALLALLRQSGPPALVDVRLRWLSLEPTLVAVEIGADDGFVYLDLPEAIVTRLLADRLVLRIPDPSS
jgi:hypothetical protein